VKREKSVGGKVDDGLVSEDVAVAVSLLRVMEVLADGFAGEQRCGGFTIDEGRSARGVMRTVALEGAGESLADEETPVLLSTSLW
jgi:hypothetical protein